MNIEKFEKSLTEEEKAILKRIEIAFKERDETVEEIIRGEYDN